MRPHDFHFAWSAIFLVLSIVFQMFGIFYTIAFIPFGIFTAFLAWVFMIRAKKALKTEFQEINEIIGERRKNGQS
jgi:hypothetical protein